MSASAPATSSPRGRLTPLRLLAAVAFAALGTVAVWQGFGLAGFGTDAHAMRVVAVAAPLFACGLVIVWPKMWLPIRVFAALIGLCAAGWAWWEVRSSDYKSAMSLREAARERDRYRGELATATLDDFERHQGLRGIDLVVGQYPSLAAGLAGDYDRWKTTMAGEVVARYGRMPPDDFKAVAALRGSARSLVEVHPAGAEPLDAAFRQWLSNARGAKLDELSKLSLGDWAAFDRTAPGRTALAEAFPETRDALLRTENDWVDSSAVAIIRNTLTPKPDVAPPTREFWKKTHNEILALKSLATGENRFEEARRLLFNLAHTLAKREAFAHFEAGRYDRAFGVVRTHAVEWSATAVILGEGERNSLDALRANYEFFAALAAKAATPTEPPDIAPPPRTKDK